MDLPQKLRRLMREHGYTQAGLGQKLGISQRAVSKWLSHQSSPSAQMGKRLADHFAVPVEALLDDSMELPPDPKREMHQILEEAPAAIRQGFLGPDVAWSHYMTMETVLDGLLAERGGKIFSAQERDDFQESIRAFGRNRVKGRAALLAALKLAEDAGTFLLSHHLALSAPPKK